MEKIPNTWGSLEFEGLLNEESSRLKVYRSNIAKRFGLIGNKIADADLSYLAMPEVLASQFCAESYFTKRKNNSSEILQRIIYEMHAFLNKFSEK